MAKRTKQVTPAGGTATIVADAPPASMTPFAPPLAVPASPAVPATPLTGMAAIKAAMAKGGATQVVKETKTGTDEVRVAAALKALIEQFAYHSARSKSAVGDMDSTRIPIEEQLTALVIKMCRADKLFRKSINVEGLLTFINGNITIEKPSKARTIEAIESDLRALFGTLYDKYIKGKTYLAIKGKNLEGEAQTLAVIQLLQTKLGDDFGELFEFGTGLELHETGDKDEKAAIATVDYVMDAALAVKIDEGITKKLLSFGARTTLRPTTEAIATAGEKLAEEMAILLEAKAKREAEAKK